MIRVYPCLSVADDRLTTRLRPRRGLLRLRVRGRLRELRERGRRRGGQLRQALAIQRAAGRLQARHELAVRQPVLARRGVDALDPERAEIALLAAASDERVLQRGVDRLFRRAIELALGLIEPFGPAQQLLALGTADVSTFDSRHLLPSTFYLLDSSTAASGAASPYPAPTPSSSPSACASGCAPCW